MSIYLNANGNKCFSTAGKDRFELEVKKYKNIYLFNKYLRYYGIKYISGCIDRGSALEESSLFITAKSKIPNISDYTSIVINNTKFKFIQQIGLFFEEEKIYRLFLKEEDLISFGHEVTFIKICKKNI